MKIKECSNPLFLLGLLIKIILIFSLAPEAAVNWYVPFLQNSIDHFTISPWDSWIENGGSKDNFPYGYVLWLVFLPLTLIFDSFSLSQNIAYGLTLILIDFALLSVFRKLNDIRVSLLLFCYWLSPIIIYTTYIVGLNDLVPVFFLTLSLYFQKQQKLFKAGFFLIAAISAKFSMILAVPFFIIHLYRTRPLHQISHFFLKGFLAGFCLFLFPFLISPSALVMLLSNPEMSRIFHFNLGLGENTVLYPVPFVYILILYAAWRVKRSSFDLFQAMLGISILAVILMVPTSPGWFLWVLPLLIYYQSISGIIATILTSLFWFLYIVYSTLNEYEWGTKVGRLFGYDFSYLNENILSIIYTLTLAVGALLVIRIIREAVNYNEYFRLSQKPFVVGVAGDSGSGKDTLVNSIRDLFGSPSTTIINGDDYHIWDRHKPIWRLMTHLNPSANDLEGLAKDLISLINGKRINLRHYDHSTGIKSNHVTIESKEFIFVNSLHALYLPIYREIYDLSIYLDMHEKLRQSLKIRRDVQERGHDLDVVMQSIARRRDDKNKFIYPQRQHADLVLALHPINIQALDGKNDLDKIAYKLDVVSRSDQLRKSLLRVLVGICGLHIETNSKEGSDFYNFTIEGDSKAEDMMLAAEFLCPRSSEFFDINPGWKDGMLGVMQLIVLTHIEQILEKRFI